MWEHTPLILATSYGAHGVIPLLLRVCRQKDACNYEGHTALDKAIIYFSLSNQFFQHKPVEIERRYSILKTLIEAGCKRVKVPDVELWVKENKRDDKFVKSIVELMCLSPSLELKSIALATLIRVDTKPNFIEEMLKSGAGFKYYMKTCNMKNIHVFEFPEILNDMVAELLIRATNHSYVHHHVVKVKSHEARKKWKGTGLLKERLVELLIQVDYPVEENYLNAFPRLYDDYKRSQFQPRNLKYLCRSVIRDSLYPNTLFGVKHLPLPAQVKSYITLDTSLSLSSG